MDSTLYFICVQQRIIYDFEFTRLQAQTQMIMLSSVTVRCRQRKQHANLILLFLVHLWRAPSSIYAIILLYWVDL